MSNRQLTGWVKAAFFALLGIIILMLGIHWLQLEELEIPLFVVLACSLGPLTVLLKKAVDETAE